MPVHDGGDYLDAAVQSILKQEGVVLELILVDDHSSDNAISKLAHDKRLKIVASPERGIVPALNAGIQHARYPFIARMDSDDFAVPNRLRTQLDYLLDNPDIDIAGARVELFKDDAELGEGYTHYQNWINALCEPTDIANSFFIESPIPHPTAFMHRNTLEALSGYHDAPWPEDYDLWCRAHITGLRFGKPSGAPLLRWRDHSKRTLRLDDRYAKQAFLKCKAFYLSEYLRKREYQKINIWGAGPTGLKLHDYLEENGVRIDHFIDVNPKLAGRSKRGKPISLVTANPTQKELQSLGGLCLVAVSARGARDQIRSALLGAELKELTDFIFVA